MNWWDYVNPFTYLGNAAGKIVADGWTAAMLGIWNAGLWLLKLILGIEDDFLVPDLSENGPMRGIYPYTFWIAGSLILILLMIQLGIAAFRRDGQSLARVLIGTAQFVMVWVAGVVYAVAVVAAAGGLTRALMESLLHVDAMAAQPDRVLHRRHHRRHHRDRPGSDGLLPVAAFGHLSRRLPRRRRSCSRGPAIAAAGLVWEGGRSGSEGFRWFHAALPGGHDADARPGTVTHTSHSAPPALRRPSAPPFPGSLILVGCFAPGAVQVAAWSTPASSGPRCRAGRPGRPQGLCAAVGPTILQRGLDSEPSGRSGEASAEAATRDGSPTTRAGSGARCGSQVATTGLGSRRAATRAALDTDLTRWGRLPPTFQTSQPLPRPQQHQPQRSGQPAISSAGRTPTRPPPQPTGSAARPCLKPRPPLPEAPEGRSQRWRSRCRRCRRGGAAHRPPNVKERS